ncbi:MAG: hypothetical protein B7X06_03610, partial [Verrucomicrobia bacterium 21-51-4]
MGVSAVFAAQGVYISGQSQPVIVITPDAAVQEREAARWLARVLNEMTGAVCTVVEQEPAHGAEAVFYIGNTALAQALMGEPDAPGGRDACDLMCVPGCFVVRGSSPQMTRWGLNYFLQKQAGVRVLMPGDLGLCIPKKSQYSIGLFKERMVPAYESRQFAADALSMDWVDYQGCYYNWDFNHALYKVFTPEVFDAHPEYFSSVRGARVRPRAHDGFARPPN